MHWINQFQSLQLDIVGIIAVLGEGSVTRNAQVTSLSWWLPTAPGIVAGAYSGTVKREINFFAQLLHQRRLDDYEVELVEVLPLRKRGDGEAKEPSFGPRQFGPLFWVTLLGCAMGIAITVLSAYYDDGFALFSTIMLSMVSCTVGIGTRWDLIFTEPKIRGDRRTMPRSDVVIYYPNGAIRVIRVGHEEIARLYFQTEHAQYKIEDTPYRTLAVLSTIMLMAGVVSLANASNILQVAFAAAYVILNGIYWAVSALNPFKYHWRHAYETQVLNIAPLPEGQDHPAKDKGHVKKLIRRSRQGWHRFQISWGLIDPAKPVPLKTDRKTAAGGNFTAALWTAIVLTGTSQWLNEATTIAPMNDAWKKWLREAETNAQPERRFKIHPAPNISHVFQRVQRMPTGIDWRFIRAATDPKADHDRRTFIRKQIESWDAGTRLTQILAEHAPMTRKPTTYEIDTTVDPVEASSASAQGTSPADGALQDAANLGRRPANVPNTTIPAESDVQIILSSPDDVEKLVEEPSSC